MKSGLVYLRPSRLAYVRATGPYETSMAAAWEQMLGWLEKNGLHSPVGRGYGLMRDCPATTAADKCRYDACVDLNPFFEERAMRELGAQTLPGGSYLRMRNVGSYDALRTKLAGIHYAFEAPAGLKMDERRPLVTIYLDDPRRFSTDELRADICVPVSARANRSEATDNRDAA